MLSPFHERGRYKDTIMISAGYIKCGTICFLVLSKWRDSPCACYNQTTACI